MQYKQICSCCKKVNVLSGVSSRNKFISTQYICRIVSCVLTVNFTSFTIVEKKAHVHIEWSTATETNNDHFEIQRSKDGAAFESIYTIPGKGNSQMSNYYSYIDTPENNGNYYYRIKQVDFSGEVAYTNMLSTNFEDDTDYYLYPNPSDAATSIYILNRKDSEIICLWQLKDQNGRSVKAGSIQTAYELPIHDLKAGVYFLEIHSPENLKIHKVFITK